MNDTLPLGLTPTGAIGNGMDVLGLGADCELHAF